MGKYAIKPTNPQDNSNGILMANCLNTISNELAEANRLKRLELNLIWDINKQSLEDRA